MNNRQMMTLLLIFAVVLAGVGVASFWIGARHGSKQTREDVKMGNGFYLDSRELLLPLPESIEPEPKRQIGFHPGHKV